ncbi:MAG: hypothetical protein Ta2A_01270 [Treponemataceae bacterium]|nr:MAG: hypothetical protein Ta2A_01270 [Treponemataceae bacterium]
MQNLLKQVENAISELNEKDDVFAIADSTCLIADIFGAEGAFSSMIDGETGEKESREQKLVTSFRKNLQLLIQKTWVEEYDEALKAQVLLRLEQLVKALSAKNYPDAYEIFLHILQDTAYLMFGEEAKRKDFEEYALRIDPEFGIFWMYAKRVARKASWPLEKSRIVLLLGMEFLAHY